MAEETVRADVVAIPIDAETRHLLVLRPARRLPLDTLRHIELGLAELRKQLSAWWVSGEQFMVVMVDPDLTIAVERVEQSSPRKCSLCPHAAHPATWCPACEQAGRACSPRPDDEED